MEFKERINKYDNMKGIGIFLVVLVHLDILNMINHTANNIIQLIYLPLLFFVAGYFSKIGSDEGIKSFKRLFIPYLIFTIITRLFNWFVLGKFDFSLIFFKTDFALWFLIALFFMKMMLPIVDRFRYPITISIICALIIGFIPLESSILGLTRCFGFFPIFLVGFYLKQSKNNIQTPFTKILNLFNKHYKIITVLIIVATIIVCYYFDFRIFTFRKGYSGNMLYEVIKRAIVLGLKIGIVLIFDKFMTNRQSLLTQFGRNSMAIYLLHCYIRVLFKKYIPHSIAMNKPLWIILILVLTFIITYILSRDVVTKYLNKFTDGIYNLIAKPI